MNEYIIYCDESSRKGPHFSNFYGGLMIRMQDFDRIRQSFEKLKEELNFHSEIKWQKVTEAYLDKYIAIVDKAFDLITPSKP